MVIIPLLFELSFSQSKIYFFPVTGCCCTFAYHPFLSAITNERKICLNSTVTLESLLCFFLNNLFVNSKNVYLGLTEGAFKKQRYFDHVNLLKRILCQQYYTFKLFMGNEKKKTCSTSSYMGSLTNCENIFQYNKIVFFMSPRETSNHYLSISRSTT